MSQRILVKLSGILLAGLWFGGGVLTEAQTRFPAERVQAPRCGQNGFFCGVLPAAPDEVQAIPYVVLPYRSGPLPARVDLSAQLPPPGFQGASASGAAWTLAYALHSFNMRKVRGGDYDPGSDAACASGSTRVYSPSYLYNQLNRDRDEGLSLFQAAQYLADEGAVPCADFPYDAGDFRRRPDAAIRVRALERRSGAVRRLDPHDTPGLQALLAEGRPLALSFKLYTSFFDVGSGVYDRPEGRFLGVQALTLVGYDADRQIGDAGPDAERGAWKVMNSWGREWGEQGYAWISFRAFRRLALHVVSLDPPGDAASRAAAAMREFGEAALPPVGRVYASRGAHANKVVLNWTTAPGASAYIIERSWADQDEFQIIGYALTPGFVDSVVQPDAAYVYRVIAQSAVGRAPAGARLARAEGYAKGQRPTGLPAMTLGLRGQAESGDAPFVQLSWQPADGARAYRVMRYDSGRRAWRLLAGAVRATAYADRRPQRNRENLYRVQALNPAGEGEWSETIGVRIAGPAQAPMPVQNLSVRVTPGVRTTLAWSPAYGATAYQVLRYDSPRGVWAGPFRVTAPQFIDESEAATLAGAWPAYLVAAENAAGVSEFNETPVYAAPIPAASPDRPTAPADLRAVQQGGATTLSWRRVDGAAQYFILRKRAGDADYSFIKNVPANVLSYRDALAAHGADLYFYIVRAAGAGESPPESGDSNAAAAFINPERALAQRRLLWDEGPARQFEGMWTAVDWDGEAGPRNIEMRIEQRGAAFEGAYRVGVNPARRFSGELIYGLSRLEADGFEMELIAGREGESRVEITNRDLAPYDVELAFQRSN